MTLSPLVQFDAVGFATSEVTILGALDLTVDPGDVIGVSGPNGAGKTTLLRLCATLLRPSTGHWSILGSTDQTPREGLAGIRRNIALIGHTPALWPELTLQENVDIVNRLNPGDGEHDPLAVVGLSAARHRRADRASLGMQRRVEFARLFRRVPRLLLLDEAHAGLDAMAGGLVDEIVSRVVAADGAAVMVSHDRERMAPLLTGGFELVDGSLVKA